MKKAQIIILLLVLLIFCFGCARQGNQSNTETEVAIEAITWQNEYDLGMQLLAIGNYQDAIRSFESAIALDSSRPEAFVKRGNAIILLEETSENLTSALNDYQFAIEIDETYTEAYLGIADVFIRQGNYEKALTTLENALIKTNQHESIQTKLTEIDSGIFFDSNYNPRRELHYYGNDRRLVGYVEFDYNENGELHSVSGYTADGTPAGYVEPKTTITSDTTEEILYEPYQVEDEIFYIRKKIHITKKHSDGSYDITEIHFWEDDEVNYYKHTIYNSDNKEILSESYDVNGNLSCRWTHEYDNLGNCIRINYFNSHEILSSYTLYEPNIEGKSTKTLTFNGNGDLLRYTVYQYDAAGKCLKYETFNNENTLLNYTVCIYDQNGIYIGDKQYDGDGNLTFSTLTE